VSRVRERAPLELVVLAIEVLLLGALPLLALYYIFLNVAHGGQVTDFENAFYPAADAVLHGRSPFPAVDDPSLAAGTAYVYPPLTAIVTVPLTALSSESAGLVAMALLVAMVVATLVVLDVRDWRCYGMAFLWLPVISAIQAANVTIPLALAAALAWRFRERAVVAGLSAGLSLALKPILWPLIVWLAATRRLRAAVWAVVTGAVALVLTWGAIGFAGMREFPDLLHRLQVLEETEGYTVYALATDLGAAPEVARVLAVAFAVSLLCAVVVVGRRGDDRRAFILALAAVLACTPIVWLHYFALLLVVVAVAEPRLGPAWFVPLVMYASTGTHNGTTAQTAVTIVAAALTVVVALRPEGMASRRRIPARASPAGGRP
jgi:Glycosyltransferase family 87